MNFSAELMCAIIKLLLSLDKLRISRIELMCAPIQLKRAIVHLFCASIQLMSPDLTIIELLPSSVGDSLAH